MAVALEAEKKEDDDIREIVKKRSERVNATSFAELETVAKAWEPQAESYDLSYEMTDLEYVITLITIAKDNVLSCLNVAMVASPH